MSFIISEALTFNYSNVFFSYYFDKETFCKPMAHEHMLAYVYSGELILQNENKKTIIRKGECVFIKKNNRARMTKQPLVKENEAFKAIFMNFSRNLLREMYESLDKKGLPTESLNSIPSFYKLNESIEITSLFHSLTPYFDTSIKPSAGIMDLKQQEGVIALLNLDKRFYQSLFDFTEPWKIDIMEFMNENYMCDMTVEQVANFVGRSLASFKRDFKDVSQLAPQRWLMRKRLEVAYDRIVNQNQSISDVYLEVGFKNLSHFSTAFKRKYGVAPSQITI